MPETPFVETEALLLSLALGDSGDDEDSRRADEALSRYLTENFLLGELHALARACDVLCEACRDVEHEVARKVP